MKIKRRKSKVVKIGTVSIGGNNPVAIQSMSKTKTADIEGTLRQIEGLKKAGCEIVRLAVKDSVDSLALRKIKQSAPLPLVADIHFHWRLALEAIDSGVDKIRLNPGNIYREEEIREVACAAKSSGIPIRVGLNSGSLPKDYYKLKGVGIAGIMARAALDYLRILEKYRFFNIVVSLKASNILDTIEAYRLFSKYSDYPLHLGVTATGTPFSGAIKSAVGLGALLLDGIGDTLRVSLTEDPKEEIKAARAILEAVGARNFGPEIISCPTCGRCEVDLVKLVSDLENKLSAIRYPLNAKRPIKIAVMGCVVNGPGEAKEADIGIAFGKKEGLFFKNGKAIKKVSFNDCDKILLKELKEIAG